MQIKLNNNLTQLGGFTPVIDDTGKITGYTTTKGGADTVFPFSGVSGGIILETGGDKYHSDYGLTKTYTITLPVDDYSAYMIIASSPRKDGHTVQCRLSQMDISGQTQTFLNNVTNGVGALLFKADKNTSITLTLTAEWVANAGYFTFFYSVIGIK